MSSFTDVRGPWAALAAYDPTTSWIIDVRAQKDKTILIKNSGTATLTFQILASIDSSQNESGVAPTFDIPFLAPVTVAAGSQSLQQFSNYFSFIQIQIQGVGAIATIKAAGFCN
jgi:hypothetical protein